MLFGHHHSPIIDMVKVWILLKLSFTVQIYVVYVKAFYPIWHALHSAASVDKNTNVLVVQVLTLII